MQTYDSGLAADFSRVLAQRESELRAFLHDTGALAEEVGEAQSHAVVDFKDMAAEQSLATVDEVKTDHAAQELEQVLGARRRLDHHSYGQCLDCGEAIDLRRLTALPATPYCTACQAIHEQRPRATRR